MSTTLFIPGTATSKSSWALPSSPLEVSIEFIENDGQFADAFRLPTVSDSQRAELSKAGTALILELSQPLQTVAQPLAAFVATLGKRGGLAVRIEQSKLGYPLQDWVALVQSEDPALLYRAAVLVLGDAKQGTQRSCGMHVFGLPDAEVELSSDSNHLLGVFNVFNLAEDPVLRSGETFSPDEQTPKRVLRRDRDGGYPAAHPCHNPFGVWRLGPPGGAAGVVVDEAFVFMPSLAALLLAIEDKQGAPLTRKQVEAVVEEAVCMKMTPRDAQLMERSRGYADLDPERAFEQWVSMRVG